MEDKNFYYNNKDGDGILSGKKFRLWLIYLKFISIKEILLILIEFLFV